MLRSRYYSCRPDQRDTTTAAGAMDDDDMSHLTSPLERMNITTPPGAIFAGAEAYDKAAEKYASRPLPPLPPLPPPRRTLRSPEPNITVARRPVGSRPRRDLPPAAPAAAGAAAEKLSSEKPLPPLPSSLLRRGGRDSWSSTRRCQSPSNPPTGHRSHKKIQKVMGCDVDVHDDGRGSRPESGYLSGSSEQSRGGSPIFARRDDDALHTGLPTPSTLGSEMSWESTRGRHIAHEARRPPTPAEQGSHQRFSNAQAARDYHKFATELAVDRRSTSEGIQGHQQQQPQRFALTKPSFFRRSRGFSATLHMPSSSSSVRRWSPPRPIDVSQTSPLLAGQGQSGDRSSSNPDERPGSAFESDSEDDDEKGKIVESIRGLVSIKKGGSRSSSRMKPHGEGSDQCPKSLLGRTREWQASRASDRAERYESQEEESKTRWREQLRKDVEVNGGRRMW